MYNLLLLERQIRIIYIEYWDAGSMPLNLSLSD